MNALARQMEQTPQEENGSNECWPHEAVNRMRHPEYKGDDEWQKGGRLHTKQYDQESPISPLTLV
jgi:hypothetical protein